MPVHRVKGGFKWGAHGHVYKSKAGAEAQARAAYANGYRGDAPKKVTGEDFTRVHGDPLLPLERPEDQ